MAVTAPIAAHQYGNYAYVRGRFEFTFHIIAADEAAIGDVDPTLALLGTQGWEIRGCSCGRDGKTLIALQRPYSEETLLPDGPVLSARLAEPLAAPTLDELERPPALDPSEMSVPE